VDELVKRAPLESILKRGLEGRCFMTRDQRGRSIYQGVIHCIVPSAQGDLVLVQYFEAMFGQLNTMALIPLASMVTDKGNSLAGYVLFEDDAHLRSYFETWQHQRDARIDAKGSGSDHAQ
jgi:hypothetical protein